MPRYEIRKAEPGELATVQEIARRTVDAKYRPFLGDENVDWFIDSGACDDEIDKNYANLVVLLKDGTIDGFAVWFDDLIHLMMVDERKQRSGLGSRLLGYCEQQIAGTGKSTAKLETFDGNDQAIGFYLKHGWRETGREADPEHGFTRVMFEKSIS